MYARVRAQLLSCVQLCGPMDCSPPGSSVHGILHARTRVGCHFLQEDLLDPWIKTMSSAIPALAGGFFTTETPGKPKLVYRMDKQQDFIV